jgi:hypothetical protein
MSSVFFGPHVLEDTGDPRHRWPDGGSLLLQESHTPMKFDNRQLLTMKWTK